jgi:hypothetical protein
MSRFPRPCVNSALRRRHKTPCETGGVLLSGRPSWPWPREVLGTRLGLRRRSLTPDRPSPPAPLPEYLCRARGADRRSGCLHRALSRRWWHAHPARKAPRPAHRERGWGEGSWRNTRSIPEYLPRPAFMARNGAWPLGTGPCPWAAKQAGVAHRALPTWTPGAGWRGAAGNTGRHGRCHVRLKHDVSRRVP